MTKNKTRNHRRNNKEADLYIRCYHQSGKYYGAYSARCAQTPVRIIVLMPEVGRKNRDQQGRNIHGQIIPLAIIGKDLYEFVFHKTSEQVQRKHIEDQMPEIGMDQPAGKKPVPLFPVRYGRGIEDEVIDDFLIIKSAQRNQGCNDDDDDRY